MSELFDEVEAPAIEVSTYGESDSYFEPVAATCSSVVCCCCS